MTLETPSISGYYWVNHRDFGDWCIYEVKADRCGKLCWDGDSQFPVDQMTKLGYVMVGPLKAPDEIARDRS